MVRITYQCNAVPVRHLVTDPSFPGLIQIMDAEDDLELVIHRARAAIARAKILSGSLAREASEGPPSYATRGQENLGLIPGSETNQGDNAEISGLPSHGGVISGHDTGTREGPLGSHAVPGNSPTLGEVSEGDSSSSSEGGGGMTGGTSGIIRSQGGMTQAVEDTLEAAASLRVYLHAQVGGHECVGSFSGGCSAPVCHDRITTRIIIVPVERFSPPKSALFYFDGSVL